jgi:hypothetical protein
METDPLSKNIEYCVRWQVTKVMDTDQNNSRARCNVTLSETYKLTCFFKFNSSLFHLQTNKYGNDTLHICESNIINVIK